MRVALRHHLRLRHQDLIWIRGRHIAATAMAQHDRCHPVSVLSTSSSLGLLEGLQELVIVVSRSGDLRSATPYTGSAGVAYALWRAGLLLKEPNWQHQASQLAAAALRRAAHVEDASLLDGRAGVLLVNCLVLGRESVQPLLTQYCDICTSASQPDSGVSDEVLYGRAGTLLGALLLRQHLGAHAVPEGTVRALAQAMLQSGRMLAAQVPVFKASGTPLAYLWPPGPSAEPYLGAAHGLMGILYALLTLQQQLPQALDAPQDLADMQEALRYVLICEQDAPGAPPGSGGHYPALMRLQGYDNSSSRTLVHWCHGAPGAVFMWCAAHEVLGDPSYLPAALRAGELVWQRGLLRKGPGLCHGVSGNAYALLRLYKTTQDRKWLERAQLYAAFIVSDAGRADWQTPDHPTSLFEGLGGAVCLLAELHAAAAAAATAAGDGGQQQQLTAGVAAPAGVSQQQQQQQGDSDSMHQAVCRLAAFPLFEPWG